MVKLIINIITNEIILSLVFFLNKIAFYYRMIFLYKEAIQRKLFDIND